MDKNRFDISLNEFSKVIADMIDHAIDKALSDLLEQESTIMSMNTHNTDSEANNITNNIAELRIKLNSIVDAFERDMMHYRDTFTQLIYRDNSTYVLPPGQQSTIDIKGYDVE